MIAGRFVNGKERFWRSQHNRNPNSWYTIPLVSVGVHSQWMNGNLSLAKHLHWETETLNECRHEDLRPIHACLPSQLNRHSRDWLNIQYCHSRRIHYAKSIHRKYGVAVSNSILFEKSYERYVILSSSSFITTSKSNSTIQYTYGKQNPSSNWQSEGAIQRPAGGVNSAQISRSWTRRMVWRHLYS